MNKLNNQKLEKMLANVGDMAFKARVKTITDQLEIKPNDKILDCGCGEGFYLKLLSKLYPQTKFWGVDYDEKILKRAKKEVNPKVKLIKANINNLPFKNNFFDKIILSEALEHFEDDLKSLKLIKKVLKKDGILIITVPNSNYPFLWDPINKILEKLFSYHIKSGFWAGIWNMHLRLYFPDQIKGLCLRAGLKIKKVKLLTHYCFPFNHLFLYGFKQLLNKGIFSSETNYAADKFNWQKAEEVNQFNWVKVGYKFLNWLDSFNHQDFNEKVSSVSIILKTVRNSK